MSDKDKQELENMKTQQAEFMQVYSTLNEIREHFNLPPVDGGDKILNPNISVNESLDKLNQLQGQPEEEEEEEAGEEVRGQNDE
jgi:hypothetical protein